MCLRGVGYQPNRVSIVPGDIVIVERDHRNKYDQNTLRVVENNAGVRQTIGWVSREIAKELFFLVDNSHISILSATSRSALG